MNKYEGYRYNYMMDAGHGWLEVKTEELKELGIADRISHYSYIHPSRGWVYLEEDLDMPYFLNQKEQAGQKVAKEQIKSVRRGDRSRIRNYPSYNEEEINRYRAN